MRRLTQIAVLGAVAFAFMYFEFPLPLLPTFGPLRRAAAASLATF